LKGRNEKLAREMGILSSIGQSLEQELANRLRNARAWLHEVQQLPLELESPPFQRLEQALHAAVGGGVEHASETLPRLHEAAQEAAAAVNRAGQPNQKRLAEIRPQLGQLRDEIAALKIGKLPFPTRVLDALNNALLSRGPDLPARHLRQLCEVVDERWRPPIEVAFTRKFAVVVSEENYDQAEKIFHSLKASDLGAEAGRESLVNPAKALQRAKKAQPGSLAEKLTTTDSVARALINDAFGYIACVETREELHKYEFAILPDGFMARGAFVERMRFYDGMPFVGEKGLEQQRAWKEKQVETLANEERRLTPLERSLKSVNERWRDHFEIAPNLYHDLARARELPKIRLELEENIAKLNQIDRSRFEDAAEELKQAEATLKSFEEELRVLDRSEKRVELRPPSPSQKRSRRTWRSKSSLL
jgi:chromosome segregation ATPase